MLLFAQNGGSSGKPIVMLFTGFHADLFDDTTAAGFSIDRAHIGYEHYFDEHWTATAFIDAGRDGGLHHTAMLKNVYVTWHNESLRLHLGIVPTHSFIPQEKVWGYRYLAKTVIDEGGWSAPADLGVSMEYDIDEWLSVDAAVLNGEGFKHLQMDNQLLYAVGVTARPLENLQLRAYYDIKTAADSAVQQMLVASIGYTHPRFTLGAEYARMWNHANAEGHGLDALSVYGTAHLSTKFDLFARYDYSGSTDPDDLWRYGHDCQRAILGLQWNANKWISLSPNVQRFFDTADGRSHTLAALSLKAAL